MNLYTPLIRLIDFPTIGLYVSLDTHTNGEVRSSSPAYKSPSVWLIPREIGSADISIIFPDLREKNCIDGDSCIKLPCLIKVLEQ